ncbi:MAG: hypothetical protein ACYCVZ_03630 [Streptosporangiaceae bacterium]
MSKDSHHTQLSTRDSVSAVTTFYDRALAQGHWAIISSSRSGYHASITARRGNTGTTVSISTAGPVGTTISVSTYPVR